MNFGVNRGCYLFKTLSLLVFLSHAHTYTHIHVLSAIKSAPFRLAAEIGRIDR